MKLKRAARKRVALEEVEASPMRYEWRVPSSPLGPLKGFCSSQGQARAEAERVGRLVSARLWTNPAGYA